MIIIEGPDGAGKTTLVENLTAEFGYHVGERGTDDRDLLWTVTVSDTLRALAGAVEAKELPVIWDRLYLSDLVYAPVVRCEASRFNRAHRNFINGVLVGAGIPIIACMPPQGVVIENVLAERHQLEGVRERISGIYRTYQDVFQDCEAMGMNVIHYNYRDITSYQSVINAITEYTTIARAERSPQ